VKNNTIVTWLSLILLCKFAIALVLAGEELEVEVLEQNFSITRYAATGTKLALWINPTNGSLERISQTAKELAKLGVETWIADIPENLFLPTTTSTQRAQDGKYVAALITAAYQHSGKQVTLISRAYGAIPALRGARLWQLQQQGNPDVSYFSGIVMFSPELYSSIPALGLEAEYVPIASASNIPIMVYQAGKRGNRWQVDGLVSKLRQGGAPVYVKIVQDVTGIFYIEDKVKATLNLLKSLPAELKSLFGLLAKTSSNPIAMTLPAKLNMPSSTAGGLQKFTADFKAPSLNLTNISGLRIQREKYLGKVTVVNFWASWCPPCVEEIPSLNNLRAKMVDKNFELISVNYAEDKQVVKSFLQKVKVDFPVLLDEDGSVSAQWKVLVYPSTFVIGPDGKIKYGVNGAIRWDSPELIQKLDALLN